MLYIRIMGGRIYFHAVMTLVVILSFSFGICFWFHQKCSHINMFPCLVESNRNANLPPTLGIQHLGVPPIMLFLQDSGHWSDKNLCRKKLDVDSFIIHVFSKADSSIRHCSCGVPQYTGHVIDLMIKNILL